MPPSDGWESVPDWAILVAQSLLNAMKERDPYTFGHCQRVAKLSRFLAHKAGLSEGNQRIIEFASLFHDLGKLGVPDEILNKPGRLSREEERLIRIHPLKSAEIIRPLTAIPFFRSLIPGVIHHHERIDGRGYPYGLLGDQIPIHAKVLLIADTYDAMTTDRPYRRELPVDIAYKELRIFSGRQFDKHLVEIFLKSHQSEFDSYEVEEKQEFSIFALDTKRRAA